MAIRQYGVSDTDLVERKYPVAGHPYRGEFQRDRDRIVHSKAFRRLEYKTQVFVNHLGDNYRTRLTHSIEVSQIARTVARSLGLNEDLTETLALAHDLGHPPFGHAGEKALHQLMKTEGGFDHNDQTLRVVTLLEERYPSHPGLNLTRATLMGLQKHSQKVDGLSHTLESQVVDVCDEIAYNNHDLDDGLQSALLNFDELMSLDLWHRAWKIAEAGTKAYSRKIQITSTIRELINIMVTDLIENSTQKIVDSGVQSISDVLKYPERIVRFSSDMGKEVSVLKKYLFKNLYRHPDVQIMNVRAEKVIDRIFHFFCESYTALPEEYLVKIDKEGNLYRHVSDFISGMTDRYALFWNKKILGID